MPISHLLRLLMATVVLACTFTAGGALAQDAGAFAQCIADSGAVFYGAHWCPYCAKQKAAFGSASKLLPYVECYRSGTREKLSRCKHIKSFPTWHFSDGSEQIGVKSLEKLAKLTGCRFQ